MDKVRDIFLYFVAAMSMFSLLGAVYQAINNEKSSAVTLGTIFLVTALVVFIPQLEVLKVWGVETKLRQSLDRAEEIIGRLRRLSVISARATYMQMAWGNRMGTPSAKDKQAILDEIDSQLTSLKVTTEERKEITAPYVQLIGFDFYILFTHTLDRYANSKGDMLVRKHNTNATEDSQNGLNKYNAAVGKWRGAALGHGPYERLKDYKLADEMQKVMPTDWLDEKERAATEKFKTEIIGLFDACAAKGGFTPAAADYYDRYHDLAGYDRKIEELFGYNPSKAN